jgi:drug/metabolite transporter (DMT)-like permease
MFFEIASKLASESLLSLYPVFVKHINLPILLQLWSRFFTYVFFSAFFVNWEIVLKHLFSKTGLALSLTTIAHVYTSYRGFHLLESGLAYTLFYTYPLMILLMAGEPLQISMIFVIFGILLLSSPTSSKNDENKKEDNQTDLYTGYVMIAAAALTEALIYFQIRHIKTENNWNHVFLSYLWGAIALSAWNNTSIIQTTTVNQLSGSLLINLVIGLFGYFLRFFAASRLAPRIYAPLSYFGIVMAYIYGFIFSGEKITWQKIVGTLLIIGGVFASSPV